ncbi:MAG: Gfo/Idh/MocA family oxidoreductase [Burkholderiales bacterium]|nr:Gfo/Idh/MocA family oxidoreductase [Burkholderiales bacterium]
MINAAIIGLGRWGQNLVNSVQGKSSLIRFVAGAVRTPERVQEYANSRGIRLYDDYRKLLADPGIDAVVLATPHNIHAELIVAAAKAGKHVFTEKPFTMTTGSAKEAVRTCAKKGVTLAVGYNWRFQPALQEIRRMLDDGRLGRLLHIEGNFCGPSVYWYPKDHWRQHKDEGPGGMTGRGVHVVDAMLYLAGHIDTVYSQSFRRTLDYGIDDTTSMLFRFRGGASGYLGTFIATAETWRMQVFGSKGWVEVGDIEHLGTWQMKVCLLNPDDLRERKRPEVLTFPDTSTERAELEHFARAVAGRKPLAVAGGDEIHGVTVLESILESARSGKPVKIGARRPATKAAAKTRKPARKAATGKRAPARKKK